MKCPKCKEVLISTKKCDFCSWAYIDTEKSSVDKAVIYCFICHHELADDYRAFGKERKKGNSTYYENVRYACRKCIVGLKDWREDTRNNFLAEHPEFNVIPKHDEVSSTLDMAKKYALRKMPRQKKVYDIEEAVKEKELLDLLPKVDNAVTIGGE